MIKYVFFDCNSHTFKTIHNCPFIASLHDMNALVPFCPKCKDNPEYIDFNGNRVCHCSNCKFWGFYYDED